MRIVRHAGADQRGFTLAELLVAIAVLGLIMTGLLSLMMSGNQAYVTGSNQIEAQQAARVALEQMVREIKGAGYNPKGVAGPPAIAAPPGFASPTATRLMINNTDDAGNWGGGIVYSLNGTNLQRQELGVDPGPQTIVGGIQALTFTYLDENNVVLAPPLAPPVLPNIRSVQISLTTQPENQPAIWQAGRVSVTMTDRIRLRNR